MYVLSERENVATLDAPSRFYQILTKALIGILGAREEGFKRAWIKKAWLLEYGSLNKQIFSKDDS